MDATITPASWGFVRTEDVADDVGELADAVGEMVEVIEGGFVFVGKLNVEDILVEDESEVVLLAFAVTMPDAVLDVVRLGDVEEESMEDLVVAVNDRVVEDDSLALLVVAEVDDMVSLECVFRCASGMAPQTSYTF